MVKIQPLCSESGVTSKGHKHGRWYMKFVRCPDNMPHRTGKIPCRHSNIKCVFVFVDHLFVNNNTFRRPVSVFRFSWVYTRFNRQCQHSWKNVTWLSTLNPAEWGDNTSIQIRQMDFNETLKWTIVFWDAKFFGGSNTSRT